MTIVRVGSTGLYSQGWDAAFGKGKKAAPAASKKSAAKKKAKKSKR